METITFVAALVAAVANVVHLVAHHFGWGKVETIAQEVEDKAEGKS